MDEVGIRPVEKIRSPSLMETGSSSGSVMSGPESSSESWSTSGKGPNKHASILLDSALRIIRSWWSSSRQPEQLPGGHRVIWTFPMLQSISGLCLCNQECPSINFCLPRLVTQVLITKHMTRVVTN